MFSAAALVAAVAMATEPDAGLRDHPIASAVTPIYLDGQWTASSGTALGGGKDLNLTIAATVPGDLLTDLQVFRLCN